MSETVVRTAEITAAGAPLRIRTIPRPALPPDMVQIKVAYAGVCHSDLHIKDGVMKKQDPGRKFEGTVLGHEIAGFVEEIGKEAEGEKLAIGDRVIVCPWKGCCKCDSCEAGDNNICTNNPAGLHDIGIGPYETGGFQSVINIKPEFLLKVDPDVGLDIACMLPCSACTVYAALKKLGGAIQSAMGRSGSARLLLIGAGGLGLWAIKLAKVMYDKIHVTTADIDESKLGLAKEAGADDTIAIDRNASPAESRDNLAKSGMYNAVIDLVGAASTGNTAILCLQTGGAMVIIGLFGGNFSVPMPLMIQRSLTVMGSKTSTRREVAEVLDLVRKNNLTFPKLDYYRHDEVNEALDKLQRGEIMGRAMIKYNV